ncbi:hypothetical protein MMC17_006332 [Xylographa soralifera]|nr:hypothetical protein [Xylographa soralifera]
MNQEGLDSRIGLEGQTRENAGKQFALKQREHIRIKEQEEIDQLLAQSPSRMKELAETIVASMKESMVMQAMTSGSTIALISSANGFQSPASGQAVGTGPDTSFRKSLTYTRDALLSHSRDLESFFHRTQIRPPFDPSSAVFASPHVSSRLREWTTSPTPGLLSLAGPKQSLNALTPSPMTTVASQYVSFASQSRLPVISYFCELPRGERLRKGNTPEAQSLVAVIYALIRQVVELLPMEFESRLDLGEERFAMLDGSLKTWKQTLSLLGDLFCEIRSVLFCVVDGWQWLDDRSTNESLAQFLRLLRGGIGAESSGFKLKVLLTTAGRSHCLLENLSRTALVLADQIEGPPGKRRSAGSRLDFDV